MVLQENHLILFLLFACPSIVDLKNWNQCHYERKKKRKIGGKRNRGNSEKGKIQFV